MPAFDTLAPDQKAVLQLLLKQGKTYEDIATLLRLDATSVRERALDALDALGADIRGAAELDSARQDELADHLLLQQTASERASTRSFLELSAPGRAWARGVSAELRPIGGDALPEIPAEPTEVAEAFGALEERAVARERQQSSSRLGGVLVLGAVGIVIVLGVFLLVRGGDDDPADPVTQGASSSTGQSSGASGASGATSVAGTDFPQQQINLEPPNKDSKALGYALLAEGGFSFLAEGLPASNMYFVWLTKGSGKADALPIGFATYDKDSKRLAGAIPALPEGSDQYDSIIVTREKSESPSAPGSIVLRGGIKQS
ncbi:MAG: hypothetical protein H0V81_05170 [Solirubrobacterales bacterium]|nr:hypothetical protein [Solirubrobacterales bacterium]